MVGVVGSSPIAPTNDFRQPRSGCRATQRRTRRHGYDTADVHGDPLASPGAHPHARCHSGLDEKVRHCVRTFFVLGVRTMVSIKLPDGAVRQFEGPVSVRDVAAAIGPGLAKAALAGKVDGKVVDTSYVIDRDASRGDRHREGPRGPRSDPAFDRAPARLRGQGTVPRRAGDDRSGDRGRLLLRLRVQAPVHARGPRRDRAPDGRAGEAGRARRALGNAARRRREVLRGPGRALQGRDHRVDPDQRADLAVPRRRLHRPLPRPARAVHRHASRCSS